MTRSPAPGRRPTSGVPRAMWTLALILPVAAGGCTVRFSATEATCGDGVVEDSEECDDGTANSDTLPDACRTRCRWPTCGDEVVDSGEECDDGEDNSDQDPDACRLDCRRAHCGDGVLDSDEECDDGGDNSDQVPDSCRLTCRLAYCGDGVIDAGEGCDDGNNVGGDGCGPSCTTVPCDIDGDGIQRNDPGNSCPEETYPRENGTDCDDTNSAIFPSITDDCEGDEGGQPSCIAYQLCDGIDNDCDGLIDEGCPPPACDLDGDGFQNTAGGCTPPPGLEDCDDSDPRTYPGAPDICGDGILQNCNSDTPCTNDSDGDGYNADVDCHDADPLVFPGALEVCNGVDDDCDGLIDEGNPTADGSPLAGVYCNDDNDGVCGDPQGAGRCVCSSVLPATTPDEDNRVVCAGEDLTATASLRCFFAPQPGLEQCDATDFDCDGQPDDPGGDNLLERGQPCGIDVGACVAGQVVGCDLGQVTPGAFNPSFICSSDYRSPSPEVCNGLDDDCDGNMRESEHDTDGDGFLDCTDCEGVSFAPGILGCNDCAPYDGTIYPTAPEMCNSVDDNCAGGVSDDGADECGASTPDCCADFDVCVDLSTDMAHCGDCTNACNALRANRCTDGICECGKDPQCSVGQVCVGNGANGDCRCTTVSCGSGCCSGTTCHPGTANNACGTGGQSCVNCTTAGRICTNHVCVLPS